MDTIQAKKIDLSREEPAPEAIKWLPAELAVKRCCVPVRINGRSLCIAATDPNDSQLLDDVRLILHTNANGSSLRPVVVHADETEIREAITKAYGLGAEEAERLVIQSGDDIGSDQLDIEDNERVLAIEQDNEVDSSVVRFVDLLLAEAAKNMATDLHIEPFEGKLRVRQRIDGMLCDVPIPISMARFTSNVVSRIKVMAQLDIAEKRLPQDGRIKTRINEKEYDLRVSVLPSSYGEAISIRILSQHMSFMPLEQLGLDGGIMPIVEDLIERPNGVILVTGPTGSGKTTFLYGCLHRINAIHRKILTVEDPIEYRMDGVVQMQTRSKIDFSFARALRSMLRHDPDVMMIGEIRDSESARITVRSALTGHLVLSTLHTNDAAGAVARLVDMDIEPFLVASSLLAVLAIRLVRILCPHCKRTCRPTVTMLESQDLVDHVHDIQEFYEPTGCHHCRYTGFKGRTGIFEILRITESVRESIQNRATTSEIKASAIREGMKTLRQDGWLKVAAGLTSIDEVLRVSHADELIMSRGQDEYV